MDFTKYKQAILAKPDKSKKGTYDPQIKKLCSLINQHPDFVTTSSCSGRIVLLQLPKQAKKNNARFLFQSHTLIKAHHIKEKLQHYAEKDLLTFKQEAPILHIATKSSPLAEALITLGQHCGFKRSTIITTKKKIVVEIRSMEQIEAPIVDKHMLISDDYLRYLVNCANQKLKKGWQQIQKLEKRWTTIKFPSDA